MDFPAVESVRNTPSTDTMPASSSQTCCADHQDPEGATSSSYLASSQEEDSGQSLPTAHVRPSHPLKSFAVPAIPPPGPPTYDPALPSTPLLSQQGEWGQQHHWRGPLAPAYGASPLFFAEEQSKCPPSWSLQFSVAGCIAPLRECKGSSFGNIHKPENNLAGSKGWFSELCFGCRVLGGKSQWHGYEQQMWSAQPPPRVSSLHRVPASWRRVRKAKT